MKIEKSNLENHEVKLDVTVEADEFEPMMAKAAKKIAGSQRIPGFRPGKAPMNVIRNMFGEVAIAQEACDLFLEQKYADILKEAEIEPGAMGRLEKVDEINPPVFTLIVPLKPTVELGDYREIREDYKEEDVTDEEFAKAMDGLKEPYATAEPFDGEIEDGMTVYTMISGEVDEALEEGGSTNLVPEMPYEFKVGADTDPDSAWPYPEFTKSLIGHKAGDVVTAEYTYPEDTRVAALAGHKTTYTVTIQEVKKMVMPEENDDFAKNFGEKYATFADLAEDVKKHLKEQKDEIARNELVEKVIGKMAEIADVKFAPATLDDEVEGRLDEIKNNLKARGLEFETWLKMQKKDVETFINDDIKPVAEEQLKRKLILQEFASKEKIGMNFEKFQKSADRIMMEMQGYLAQAKTKKDKENLQNYVTEQAMNESFLDSVFDRIAAIAKGENPAIDEPEAKEADLAENAAKAAAEAAAEIEAEKAE